MKEQIEKKIIEMAKIAFPIYNEINPELLHTAIFGNIHTCKPLENLYNAGYIKIVPCKDCEHFYKVGSVGICRHWNFHSTKDDAYCSFAKMKGGAE